MCGGACPRHDAEMSEFSATAAQVLHESGQEALLELELATLDMTAHEKWMLEQLLLAYVADSVPEETWHEGLATGIRAVKRDRDRNRDQQRRIPDVPSASD